MLRAGHVNKEGKGMLRAAYGSKECLNKDLQLKNIHLIL